MLRTVASIAAGVVEVMNSSHEEYRFTLIVDDYRSLEVWE